MVSPTPPLGSTGKYFAAILEARAWALTRGYADLRRRVDRDRWSMTAPTVNASRQRLCPPAPHTYSARFIASIDSESCERFFILILNMLLFFFEPCFCFLLIAGILLPE